jgi:N-acetylmuramoyl-L-alanine amidase
MKNINIGNFFCHFNKIITLILFVFLSAGFLQAQDYQTTKAFKGEGIYGLLKRHGLPPGEYLNSFIELNKGKLGKDNSLFEGRVYTLPTVPTKEKPIGSGGTIYPIFGKTYEQVKLVDNALAGAVYYLKSGHGGPDPGAVGRYGNNILCEDEYAYDVTLRLARVLLEHGATVYMITRDDNDGIRDDSYLKADKDETCYPNLTIPRNQLKRLQQRTESVNKLYTENRGKFQRLIILHIDSRSVGQNIDVFFYHDKRSNTGKKLALNLQQVFKEKYDRHQPNRGYHGTITDRNLYVLKHSYPPAVFIELGNINHFRDQQRFLRYDNRQALANWMAEGLLRDFKNNK